jgi:hypothetical protein
MAARAGRPRLSLGLVVEEDNDRIVDLLCFICQGILCEPITPCQGDHQFCSTCWYALKERKCPMRCNELLEKPLVERKLQNRIMGLKMMCPNSNHAHFESKKDNAEALKEQNEEGEPVTKKQKVASFCQFVGRYEELLEHLEDCDFVTCEFCLHVFETQDYDGHLYVCDDCGLQTCKARNHVCKECEDCGQLYGYSQDHERNCPKGWESCAVRHKEFERENLNSHLLSSLHKNNVEQALRNVKTIVSCSLRPGGAPVMLKVFSRSLQLKCLEDLSIRIKFLPGPVVLIKQLQAHVVVGEDEKDSFRVDDSDELNFQLSNQRYSVDDSISIILAVTASV